MYNVHVDAHTQEEIIESEEKDTEDTSPFSHICKYLIRMGIQADLAAARLVLRSAWYPRIHHSPKATLSIILHRNSWKHSLIP